MCDNRAESVNESLPVADDLVYDVGLHKGEDSAFYLAKGYRVVAFEADDGLIAACKERFAGEIAAGRMRIVEGAITTSGAATVRFYRSPVSAWGTTNEVTARNEQVAQEIAGGEAVEVPAVDFAQVLRETGMPSFMKIDIEGSDRICLEALLELGEAPQSLSIESSKGDWRALEEEFALLSRLGYDRFAVVPQVGIRGSVLNTRALDGSPVTFRFEGGSGPFGSDVGPWMDREAALARYRRLFREERLFGPRSPLRKSRLGRRAAHMLLGGRQPSWYDTHAARAEDWGAPTFVDDVEP